MPKHSRGGSRGGRGGRGRGGGRSGVRGRSGHSVGPGGDGCVKRSLLSRSHGVVERNDDPHIRGARKVRGGGGGFGRRGNMNRHDVTRDSLENEDNPGEKIPTTTSDKDEKTALTKQNMKRRNEEKVVTGDAKQTKEEMSMTKTPSKTPLTSSSPASSQQPSPPPEQPPPVFASQDVRFKQNPTTSSPVMSSKSPKGAKNQTPKKVVKPPKPPTPSIEATINEQVPKTPLSSPSFKMSNYTSHTTGLKVLSVTSSYPGYVFTPSDRAKLVRTIPGVVIINTAAKGDCLIMGVDIEDEKLAALIPDMEKDESWTISFVDTTERDVFSYFKGWKVIPRVDKSGMFQLIVSLRAHGWRSRDEELKKRNQLLELVKDYNIAKVVHGEGETILLVGHVLEMVSYSDTIRKVFSMERRHTWQPRPRACPESPPPPTAGQEKHFWVKVKCPEMTNLSPAHKQYSVYHELSMAGKVLQLEYLLFGVVDNYLVVFKDIDDTATLGQNFLLLEIWPDSLPDLYTPTYGVDDWGFYSVSGSFPPNLDTDTRNRFAEDMKMIGAVGFRSGDVEDSFSLHFVNSRCLEQISRCAQFISFRLTILSSLVRKPGLDKKLKKLVPAIIKYQELKMAVKVNFKLKELSHADVEIDKPVKQVESLEEAKVESFENVKTKRKIKNVVDCSKKDFQDVSLNKSRANAVVAVNEVSSKKAEDVFVKKSKVKSKNIEGKKVVEMSQVVVQSVASSVQLNEDALLKICWKEGGSLSSYLKNLSKFFGMVQDVVVTETEVGLNGEVLLKFPSRKKVDEVLNILSDDTSNTVDKVEMATPKVDMMGSKFYKNRFGLVIYDKSSTVAKLKKDFAKFGSLEIEARSRVFVLWFEARLSLFKALADHRRLGHQVVPSVQNFKLTSIAANPKPDEELVSKVEIESISTEEFTMVKLTEREIFGFIWQKKPKGKKTIRDDQVISRQVTNFIKNVSCQELTVDEDGLVVVFSSQAELTTTLTQFCPSPVPGSEQLQTLARKFTILPARGGFGLFSAKRIKPEHLERFGDCKVRNCGIWFVDKLAMFKVLRDPFISKTYPALFIDCRNIFILTSKDMLPATKITDEEKEAVKLTDHEKKGAKNISSDHEKMAVDEQTTGKPVNREKTAFESTAHKKITVAKPGAREKSVAKSAIQEKSIAKSTTCEELVAKPEETIAKPAVQEKVLDSSSLKSKYSGVTTRSATAKLSPSKKEVKPSKKQSSKSSAPTDAAIVTAVASTATVPDSTTPCPLLSTLLAPDQPGKFGHIPSGRMVRTGYKQSRMPAMTRGGAVADLYLEDRDCYRKKNVKEAADLISNIVQGKMSKVTGDTLREIKMKRVESYLKDKLGFEDQLKLKITNVEEKVDNFTKLMEPIVKACKEDDLKQSPENENLTQSVNLIVEASSISCSKLKETPDVKTTKVIFEKLENVHKKEVFTKDYVEPIPSTNSHDSDNSYVKLIVDEAAELTPDLIGLFTLTLPVSPGSDLVLLSSLQDDISWFDTPASILCMEDCSGVSGVPMVEVKLRDKDMAMAVLTGLKHKYPGLEGDTTGSHADILPDKETGLYTLCFSDTKKQRYKGTMEKFKEYSKQVPLISRGFGAEQVLVGFQAKEDAVKAFRENLDSEEFPELHVASASRG